MAHPTSTTAQEFITRVLAPLVILGIIVFFAIKGDVLSPEEWLVLFLGILGVGVLRTGVITDQEETPDDTQGRHRHGDHRDGHHPGDGPEMEGPQARGRLDLRGLRPHLLRGRGPRLVPG